MNKRKLIPFFRKSIQVLGLILTTLGFLYQLPLASGLLIGVSFLMGPIFCGWVCPFGAIQDFSSRLGSVLNIKKRTLPILLQKLFMPLRYVLLATVLLLSSDYIFEMLSLDPMANFSNFLNGSVLTLIGWLIILTFLAISLFFERPFCNFLCVEGAKYGLFSTTRIMTIVRNENSCISCNKCNKSCPMNIDVANLSQVRSPQCINCFECVSQCPVPKTLEYKVLPLHKYRQKIVATFFLFLGLSFSFLYVQAAMTGKSVIDSYLSQDNETETATETVTEDTTVIVDATQPSTNETQEIMSETQSNETLTSDETTAIINTTDASGIADGTYEGSGTGFRGEMTVEVTVENEQITSIEIISTRDDQKWLSRAYNGVSSSILEEQTVDVDSVSGATYSSVAIMNAVKDALENAGGTHVSDVTTELPTGGRRH